MSAEPATVALVTNALTIGGTEKGLVGHALALDRSRFEPRVVCVKGEGPRRRQLEDAGVRVDCAGGERSRLEALLRGLDVVHVWRAGTGEAAVPTAAAAAGVPTLVETNVFGLLDRSRHAGSFDCHLFLSRSCAVRYRRRAGLDWPSFHRRHRVLPLPLDTGRLRALAPSSEEAKRRLGLDPSRPVVGRVGRADDFKWRSLLVDMLPRLRQLVPDVQVLLVGATPAKRRRLERRGQLEACRLEEPVADEAGLAALYAACDVFVTAAELGESQGLAIAEAMALGIPVVTCSTPWVDNAQIEYVDHGRTGYVANHPRPFAEAVAGLLRDPARRERLGAAGRAEVERLLDVMLLTRRLETLYQCLLREGTPPERWEPSAEQLCAFESQERDRARRAFRPLRPRERLAARVARERERARRVGGLLRPRMLPLAAAMARARATELRLRACRRLTGPHS